jgi:hypothetical protein
MDICLFTPSRMVLINTMRYLAQVILKLGNPLVDRYTRFQTATDLKDTDRAQVEADDMTTHYVLVDCLMMFS